MKKIFKRVSVAVIVLAVVVTAVVFDVPGKIIAAAADHTNHAECGDASCTEHSAISDWTGISDLSGLETGKNYYLTDDVQLTNAVGISGDITLCLNGYNITAASSKRVFYVYSGNSLTLCDCKGTGKLTGGNSANGVVYVYSGTFTMYGGTISGNTYSSNGGGVYVYNKGTFTMYGGTISDNNITGSYNAGGGVYVNGSGSTFKMYG
ncbi:MAG: hypothetical protein K2O14_04335, partial [Oscillospiraceae bacterium]|nr:hypothetical protein [Oscillospiraceae bacterium]